MASVPHVEVVAHAALAPCHPEAPVISCPGDFGLCTDAGQCYATVDLNGCVSAVAVTGVVPLANC